MRSVLKFPLEKVRRTTASANRTGKSAEILFFTGVRYERDAKKGKTLLDKKNASSPSKIKAEK